MRVGLLCLVVLGTSGAHARDEFASAEFSACAAYYFLNSNVSPLTDYERLYQSGERSLNHAARLADSQTAQADFDKASNDMMELMNRDWTNFDRVEVKFGARCAALLSRDDLPY